MAIPRRTQGRQTLISRNGRVSPSMVMVVLQKLILLTRRTGYVHRGSPTIPRRTQRRQTLISRNMLRSPRGSPTMPMWWLSAALWLKSSDFGTVLSISGFLQKHLLDCFLISIRVLGVTKLWFSIVFALAISLHFRRFFWG